MHIAHRIPLQQSHVITRESHILSRTVAIERRIPPAGGKTQSDCTRRRWTITCQQLHSACYRGSHTTSQRTTSRTTQTTHATWDRPLCMQDRAHTRHHVAYLRLRLPRARGAPHMRRGGSLCESSDLFQGSVAFPVRAYVGVPTRLL